MTTDSGPLTLEEAADLLGVHYMTAYRYVRTGRLAATKVDRRWVVDPADLAALSEGGEVDDDDPGANRSGQQVGRAAYPELVRQRLLAADEAGTWQIVEQAMASGMEPSEVLLDLIGPAMAEIGHRWSAGEVSVVMEHQATATAHRVVGRLGTRFARRGQARATVVLGAAPGDHHALPSAILRDLLRGRGLAVIDLGGAVPVDSWASAAADAEAGSPPLVAVGIGASSAGADDELAQAITAIHQATGAPVILGGTAIDDAAHARRLGADHYSSSSRAALELLDR